MIVSYIECIEYVSDHQAVEAPPAPAWNIEATKDNKVIMNLIKFILSFTYVAHEITQEKPIDDELASFYSDIAKLEPETTNEENSCENPDPSASPENTVSDGDDKKKKKKKKSKKLEPWRSGDLSKFPLSINCIQLISFIFFIKNHRKLGKLDK